MNEDPIPADTQGSTQWRAFWFCYHSPFRLGRAVSKYRSLTFSRSLHEVRDGLAFSCLQPVLLQAGRQWGGPLLNLPAQAFTEEKAEEIPPLDKSDLLALCTRPPISDGTEPDPKVPRIQRSQTDLEKSVLATIENLFLEDCSRKRVLLAAPLVTLLARGRKGLWTDVRFRSKASACYEQDWAREVLQLNPKAAHKTVAYLLYTPHVFHHETGRLGPALLNSFAMAGTANLFWHHCLARPPLRGILLNILKLGRPHFLMAEWDEIAAPARPTSLDFLDGFAQTVRILVQAHAQWVPPVQMPGTPPSWDLPLQWTIVP
jgi:hypothetical protein